ncbi:MAG TPA: ABC transporter ATP-binding protein [Bacteroidetes bacterium]|nr:ABC transporter ATP-binding protein [Bacteroidota bacterium]
MSVETFSGGWKMRLELAKLLLQNHALMLLDEPTNHLDIESIIWLEGFLIERNATLIVVSHDIEFLNRVTNRTIEISLGRIYDHMGNYSKFIEWRKDVKEKQIQSKKNQDKKIAETKQLIEKFRAKASKAAFAQSLIKKMNKMDRIEVDEDDTRSMHFRFPKTERAGQKIVTAKALSKSYDDNLVLNEIDLELLRGEKIAFVGQNGQGKSTLVKLITKEIMGKGHIELGHNVQLGYYAQDQTENITDNRTVLKTVEDAAPDNSGNIARKLLGAFMFSGEDVEKKARILSGGERARLAMCQLMLKPINFLVMDEPTNHLDIISKQTLKKALKDFDGTLLVVSHDRAFLEGLVEKTYEFRDSKLIEYLGGIEYFLEKRKVDSMREVEQRSKEKLAKKKGGKNDHQIRKENDKQARKKQNRIKKLEADIGALETEISSQEVDLKDPNKFQDISTDNTFFTAYEDNKKTLEKLMKEWEGLIE